MKTFFYITNLDLFVLMNLLSPFLNDKKMFGDFSYILVNLLIYVGWLQTQIKFL